LVLLAAHMLAADRYLVDFLRSCAFPVFFVSIVITPYSYYVN
jgi:hypothetical protein